MQVERTRLAWVRTGLAAVVLAALVAHDTATVLGAAFAVGVLLCAAGLVLCGRRPWVGLLGPAACLCAVASLLAG